MQEWFQNKMRHNLDCLPAFGRWAVISILCGAAIGLAETALCLCINYAVDFRAAHPWIILGLPIAGLLTVGLYKLLNNENDTGTNLLLSVIQSGGSVPFRMTPCIFVSTVMTHLFGGSAGRTGASLQLGGSLGSSIGALLHLDDTDRKIITMCGMSAAFSVLFQTPVTAAILPLEIACIGNMQYSALLPCAIASLTAHETAVFCGFTPEMYTVTEIPAFSWQTGCAAGMLAVCCAFVSMLFCTAVHKTGSLYQHFFKNICIRTAAGGIIVTALTFLVGSQAYNGASMNLIKGFMEKGSVFPAAFLIKILFTACTSGAGFKGGEIGPAFYTGASFGCLFSMLSGFSAKLSTAVGMTAVFCGVTNCPVSALLISLEFFGQEGMLYYLLTISVSYMLSGYSGLYSRQKIIYPKYR